MTTWGSGIQIRAEDIARQVPDAVATAWAAQREATRLALLDAERVIAWRMRRDYALAVLAGWCPPTVAQRWWAEHERDALAFAEVFAPD